MADFSTPHYFTAFTFLVLFFKIVASTPISSFSFTDFDKDLKAESNVAFFGGSKVVNGGSEVQISGSESHGGVMYKKPIKLIGGKRRQLISFSTYFAFSILSVDGDGLAFVMVPNGFQDSISEKSSSGVSSSGWNRRKSMVVDVKFTAKSSDRNGDSGSAYCNVDIDVGDLVPAKTSNTSSLKMALRNGEKIHTWIDYEASSQRLEVRLSQVGHSKPVDPLIWYSIDFSKIWKKSEKMFVGLNSVKGNSTTSFNSQPCFLYSWSFNQRPFPHWMHSEPMDLKALAKNSESVAVKPRSDCVLRVLAAMIFGGGCGALTTFIVLYLWTIFGNRRPVVPEECAVIGEQPVDFEYKKVSVVVVDKAIKDGKE